MMMVNATRLFAQSQRARLVVALALLVALAIVTAISLHLGTPAATHAAHHAAAASRTILPSVDCGGGSIVPCPQ